MPALNDVLSIFPCQFFMNDVFFVRSFMFFLLFRRFELRGLLALWNSMLAMFSIMGAFRTAPELIHVLRNYGLFHSVCVPRWVSELLCLRRARSPDTLTRRLPSAVRQLQGGEIRESASSFDDARVFGVKPKFPDWICYLGCKTSLKN